MSHQTLAPRSTERELATPLRTSADAATRGPTTKHAVFSLEGASPLR